MGKIPSSITAVPALSNGRRLPRLFDCNKKWRGQVA